MSLKLDQNATKSIFNKEDLCNVMPEIYKSRDANKSKFQKTA